MPSAALSATESTIPKSKTDLRASARDDILVVVVDPDDFNEYLVFKDASPKLQKFRFTGRRFDDSEVVAAGLLAGTTVEVARVIVMHPLDTIRTRQQSAQALELQPANLSMLVEEAVPFSGKGAEETSVSAAAGSSTCADVPRQQGAGANPYAPLPATQIFVQPWQGLGTALVTSVPQGAIFWAVKDVVRREMLARLGITAGQGTIFLQYFTPQYASPPILPAWAIAAGLDWRAIATIVGVAAGEAAYWLARAPTEVAKTRAQVRVIDPMVQEGGEGLASDALKSEQLQGTSPPAPSPFASLLSVFEAYPTLALTDLPVVVLRVCLFLLLKASDAAALLALDSALTSDLVLYILASIVANGLTTPLEVVRTRLLLQRSGEASAGATQYRGIADALATIYREEGVEGLYRGLRVRLVWNGLWLGVILGLQRAAYVDVLPFFFGLVEVIEDAIGSEWEEWVAFLTRGSSVMQSSQLDPSAILMQDSLSETLRVRLAATVQ